MTTAADSEPLPSSRIAFDATALYSGATGVARYVRELGRALEDRSVNLAPFAIGRGRARPHGLSVRRLRVPLRVVHRSWATIARPRAEWLVRGCDMVHSTDLIPPPTRRRLVVTVHDLDAVSHPELHPPRAVAIQRAQLAAARQRASVVLAPAATSARLSEHGVDPDRIVETTYGVTPFPDADFTLVPRSPFLLVVGSLNARKGQDALVQALARAQLGTVHLVLAGPDGWDAWRVRATIDKFDMHDRVTVTGPITDAQLAGLYRRCLAVCLPSRAEGFGIPILEGAAYGRTIVASDIPAARELEPAVAVFAPPDDPSAWAAALERAVHDGELQAEAAVNGPTFARAFTWDRVADATLTAYRKALDLE